MSPTPCGDHVPAAISSAYPPRPGNVVRPLVDGDPAFTRILEAVEAAESTVWVAVAFIETDLELPGGRGSLFDVLDRAFEAGVDVRCLVWDPDEAMRVVLDGGSLPADERSHALLAERETAWSLRWDRVVGQCQHQKSWVVDAGTEDEVAFVGGINLNQGSIAGPDHVAREVHEREGNVHDLYVEVAGPAGRDVAANFVERWNLASERAEPLGSWPPGETRDLGPVAEAESAPGGTIAQVTRSILPGLYGSEVGENSVREQYLAAIGGARHWIHLENQILLSRAVLEALDDALARGVHVTALVPAEPMPVLKEAAAHPGIAAAFERLDGLARYPHFTLAAPAVNAGDGAYEEVYVHAKAALVDDAWATIGSTNLVFTSFQGDTEMNLSWWDEVGVHALRVELLEEHLAEDTSRSGPVAAAERFAARAEANREARAEGRPLIGHAVAIDPAGWAR